MAPGGINRSALDQAARFEDRTSQVPQDHAGIGRSTKGPSLRRVAREAQHYANQGKERAIQLLRTARQWLQDELAATDADAGPVAGLNTTAHTGLHPQIRSKCEALYASSAFAEAVEKSFKVVRDRLRELTGYEKGSEAFGKGRLHIKGAAAQHVDSDFNDGAKFLMMAIDMFRNEKSHTADAKITDPVRAEQ